jgi:hypothetical protein
MKQIAEAQKLAHYFNEDEAMWRAFEDKRALRRLLGSDTPLSEDILDYLDWQAAAQECRAVSAVGFLRS